jgi:hypothetical protein
MPIIRQPPPEKPERKPRKPSVSKMVRTARKLGVASVTTPDGFRLDLSEPKPDSTNEWDEELWRKSN